MSTLYPGGIDSFDTRVDGVTDVMASDVNDLQDAMVAVQTESQLRTLFRVKNASGATVVANDCGYIDEAGDFKTTTTASLNATWAVVVTGGANNSQIMVCTRGRLLVNYRVAGGVPSINHFLVTSTTAGEADKQETMRPEVFAVCLANGADGTVEVLLLTGTQTRILTNAKDVMREYTTSDTDFTATINGAPVADAVAYNLVTGAVDTINVLPTGQVGRMVLYNTVGGRTASALIEDAVAGTITLTANAPGDWVHGDTIQARSTTVPGIVPGFATVFLYDIDLSEFLPELVRSAMFTVGHVESAPGGNFFVLFHPALGAAPVFADGETITGAVAGIPAWKLSPIGIYNKLICFGVSASGAATSDAIIRIRSIDVAMP